MQNGRITVAGETSSTSTRFLITNLISLQFTLFAICLSFSSPPLHKNLSFYSPSSPRSPLFRLFLVCMFALMALFVAMAQDATKLCDFTNTNNNDFLSTPIAPLANTESCEINTTLLNLVMKDQFAGLPSEDAATHLNGFVDYVICKRKRMSIMMSLN